MKGLHIMRPFLTLPVVLLVGACASTAPTPGKSGRGDPVAMLVNADANRDGVVTRDEFRTGRDGMFSTIDRNHDGFLSSEDSPRRRKRAGGGGERMKQLAAGLDANRDGRVSRAEFVDGPALMFDRADANGDDVVDAPELSALKAAVTARREAR